MYGFDTYVGQINMIHKNTTLLKKLIQKTQHHTDTD